MDLQSFIFYMVMIVFAGAWWNNYRLRNKVICYYTRISGQEVKRVVSMQDNFVVIDGNQCELTTDRARDVWYDDGLFGRLFPTWMKCYHFNAWDYLPENYKEHGVNWEDPANRRRINARNDMQVFVETQAPQEEPKKSKFTKYLPWIIGFVVLVVGYYVYSYISNLQAENAAMQATINALQ